ncbi:MAG: hypothetical protein F4173_10540 [Acidobacteriia bacterium]|nr:hypothetical protein [Terriglobia bacterium]
MRIKKLGGASYSRGVHPTMEATPNKTASHRGAGDCRRIDNDALPVRGSEFLASQGRFELISRRSDKLDLS